MASVEREIEKHTNTFIPFLFVVTLNVYTFGVYFIVGGFKASEFRKVLRGFVFLPFFLRWFALSLHTKPKLMKKIFISFFFPAFLLACGGNEGSEASSDDIPAEIEATATEIQTVEETETIGSQVDEVNQDVDSILNSL